MAEDTQDTALKRAMAEFGHQLASVAEELEYLTDVNTRSQESQLAFNALIEQWRRDHPERFDSETGYLLER